MFQTRRQRRIIVYGHSLRSANQWPVRKGLNGASQGRERSVNRPDSPKTRPPGRWLDFSPLETRQSLSFVFESVNAARLFGYRPEWLSKWHSDGSWSRKHKNERLCARTSRWISFSTCGLPRVPRHLAHIHTRKRVWTIHDCRFRFLPDNLESWILYIHTHTHTYIYKRHIRRNRKVVLTDSWCRADLVGRTSSPKIVKSPRFHVI